MTPAPLHLAGERLMLDPTGVLAWPARGVLTVADLHLEKGSHHAAAGRFLPPYDTRETLARLAGAIRRWRPQRLIALGDSFHDRHGAARLPSAEAALLRQLLAGIAVTWVLGNHDPLPPEGLPGEVGIEWRDGPLTFRHQARPGAAPGAEISGHFHPKATMPTRCGGVTRACFVADARRVLLPAFGAYTGGLDTGATPVAALFPRGARLFLLGRDRLYSMPAGAGLRPAPAEHAISMG